MPVATRSLFVSDLAIYQYDNPVLALTRYATGDIGARAIRLASGHNNIRPSPAGARATTTSDNYVVSAARNSTRSRDVLNCQISDGDAA